MPSLSLQPAADTTSAAQARQLPRFGFPRIYLAQMLRQKIAEQLCVGLEACTIGRRDADGRFHALEDGDDFDGPQFTLRLTHAVGGHQVFDHDIDIGVGILLGSYVLNVRGHRFSIAFLPTLDNALLVTAVRWMIRNLDTALRTH